MRLNAEDGGTRQSILVTNNEVGAKQAKELRKAGHHPGDPEWEAHGRLRVRHPAAYLHCGDGQAPGRVDVLRRHWRPTSSSST